jgi:hypothetical protein
LAARNTEASDLLSTRRFPGRQSDHAFSPTHPHLRIHRKEVPDWLLLVPALLRSCPRYSRQSFCLSTTLTTGLVHDSMNFSHRHRSLHHRRSDSRPPTGTAMSRRCQPHGILPTPQLDNCQNE